MYPYNIYSQAENSSSPIYPGWPGPAPNRGNMKNRSFYDRNMNESGCNNSNNNNSSNNLNNNLNNNNGNNGNMGNDNNNNNNGNNGNMGNNNNNNNNGNNGNMGNDNNNNNNGNNGNMGNDNNNFVPNSEDILETLISAANDELNGAEFYNLLSKKASPDDREILIKIQMDEIKHHHYLSNIYRMLTGQNMPTYNNINPNCNPKDSINVDIENGFYDELKAMCFYRKLLFMFLSIEIRDMIYEIMTDEQNHAAVLSFIGQKYN